MVRQNAAVGRGGNWILKVGFPNAASVLRIQNSFSNSKEATKTSLLQEICCLVDLAEAMLISGLSWRQSPEAKLPYVTILTKTWNAWIMFPPAPVEGRAMWPGVGVGSLLSGVIQSTCDPHVHLTMYSDRDKPKSSGLKLLCGVHSTEGVERSANQQEAENNSSKWKIKQQINRNWMSGGKENRFCKIS